MYQSIDCASSDIGHMVTIKGLVTKTSDVKPRIRVCTYTCEVCGSEIFQDVSEFFEVMKRT